MVVRTGILDYSVTSLAETGITADPVLMFVPLPVRHVDTQTDCVLVRQDGRVQDVMKNVFSLLERTVNINAVNFV